MFASKAKRRISIATKFNLLTILIILVTSAGISFFLVHNVVSYKYNSLVRHGLVIASMASQTSEYYIYTGDTESMMQLIESLEVDEDVAYVCLFNKEKKQLMHKSFKYGLKIPPAPVTRFIDCSPQGKILYKEFFNKENGNRYIDILSPVIIFADKKPTDILVDNQKGINPEIAGYVQVGLSLENLHKRIKQFLISALAFTSFFIMVGVILTLFLTKRITAPLKKLNSATKNISEGIFEQHVNVHTNDEISDFAGAFNHMVERLRVYRDQLRHTAFHDPLTNLPNRNLFMERLERLIEHAKRDKNCAFSVLFLDLDRFKVVNDSLGHLAGDKLLVLIAQKLEECLRKSDTVARFGGDEFAILLDNVDDDFNAKFVAERILEILKDPFVLDGHRIVVSASIGIVLKGEFYNRPEDILRDADTTMYRAKMNGKARYAVFNTEMHASAMNFLQLEADLWHAIERSELVIYYQPIVSLTRDEIVGLESLIRWQHPQRGLILPDEFIPLAEETRMIDKIGHWVIQKACAQNKVWHDMGFSNITITVNVSVLQLRHRELPDQVRATIKSTGLPAGAFKLEITESTVMESRELVLEIFKELNDMKIQLMMDDFGIGFSSIHSLKNLPFSTLKIDRSLISDIAMNPDASAIVKAIIDMARSLKIKVIAEGVETQRQLELLRLYQCDYIQGYLFYSPMKAEEITNILRQRNKPASDTNSDITREFITLWGEN
ncbi:MAG: GGDEF domain-containing protein [Candidatus Brocadia sp. AMX2]|uniref:Phosphodiesterase with PAS/PAC sensor n=1 Tax=Candidatus Brocadia sinica JPN1 TaxID=1197129 RepID=A0ABQ0K1F2_9BACT|nr:MULTISPECIES: EAL domain-containing protein [Brocadia]KXK30768.1 MAG: diguanylate cyclase/phosphodiesterase [Candidatus Brocadia sinica]MBC6932555.1 GGDEF domain-containing protein [Candidatus Brocadia sp.]MBL1168089.1 EAL domain-containing protein [Candidatus Brocadia sp. AMX1]NOG42671.1 EAL domain-containing protein [Planctomycetota bacterium]KAA0243979.1 MAG: EAL domain-containing protein [Candidatus Brocadia sp. AMX2]